MFDDEERQWLEEIESKKQVLVEVSAALKTEIQRNARLCTAKSKETSAVKLAGLKAAKDSCEKFVTTQTEQFFARVLGISLYSPVALRNADGTLSHCIYPELFIARQLHGGDYLFTAAGDSAVKDLHAGMPAYESLTARESRNERLIPV